jgi:hypothetical protein
MEDYLYGRLTTLNRLKAVRDDPKKHKFHRLQADQAIARIKEQMKDRTLLGMRERLIKATRAGDLHEVYKIECSIRAHEGQEVEA